MSIKQLITITLIVFHAQCALARDDEHNPFKRGYFDRVSRVATHCGRAFSAITESKTVSNSFVLTVGVVTFSFLGYVGYHAIGSFFKDEHQRLISEINMDTVNWASHSPNVITDVIQQAPPEVSQKMVTALKSNPFHNDKDKGKELLNTLILRLDLSRSKTIAPNKPLFPAIEAMSSHGTPTFFSRMLSYLYIKIRDDRRYGSDHFKFLQATAALASTRDEANSVGKAARVLLLNNFFVDHLYSESKHPFSSDPQLKDEFFWGLYMDMGGLNHAAYAKQPTLYKRLYERLSNKEGLPTPDFLKENHK